MTFHIKILWTVLILTCSFHVTFSAYLRCYKGSISDYEEAPIDSPECLATSSDPYIDVFKCLIIFCHGWNGDPTGPAVSTLIPFLLNYTTCSICLTNWEKEASGGILGPVLGYGSVLKNVEPVGRNVGKGLLKLQSLGLNMDSVQLIGHSMGAHVAGYSGRETQAAGVTLPRITGLENARPGFEENSQYKSLDVACAAFVDSIHTDPGGYGQDRSLSCLDIWVNEGAFEGGDKRQPGCESSSQATDVFVGGSMCNHNRVVELYAASLAHPDILECGIAADYDTFVQHDGIFDSTNFIGPAVDETNVGNCYLSTTGTSPFGEGDAGLKP